jgi:hypothetical protein
MLDAIPATLERQYGFQDTRERANARLGRPYPIYTVSPADPNLELLDTRTWRIPVLVDLGYRSMLTVVSAPTGWEAVEIGGAGLASHLQELENRLPSAEQGRPRAFLRVFQLSMDFVLVDSSSGMAAWPLPSATRSLGLDPFRPLSMVELRAMLRQRLAIWRQQPGLP